MRIVIDMQGIQNGSRFRGIGRYTNALVKQLILEANREHEILLVLNGAFDATITTIRAEYGKLLPQSCIHVWQPLIPASYLDPANDGRRLASEAIRETFFATLKPDVVLISSMVEGAGDNTVTSVSTFCNLPTAVIFYDLIPLIYEKEYLADQRVKSWYLNKIEFLKRADLLLAISDSTRIEGMKHLSIDESKIVNISAALAQEFLAITPRDRSCIEYRFNVERPYLLYSGASDPRKNLPRLISAYARLAPPLRAHHQLVVAGGMPSDHITALKACAREYGCDESSIIFTGHISDQELVDLYAHALGLVFPSYHEGFGLPILEAMYFGIPVIGANNSSVPEVIGNSSALFDPFSVESIADAMTRLLTSEQFRLELADHSRLQREQFSWESSAQRLLKALTEKFINHKLKARNNTIELQDLITKVAHGLSHAPIIDSEIQSAAAAIDQAMPRNGPPHRLYVDISELHTRDSGSGVQRVVRNILAELLSTPIQEFDVIPVFATITDGYREARQWLARYRSQSVDGVENEPLIPRSGDVFLGLDLNHELAPLHVHQLQSFRNQGVKVAFVVYDLLPITMPQAFWAEMTENHKRLLRVLSTFDTMIGISRVVADELRTWLADEGLLGSNSPQIEWFHLGADLDIDIRGNLTPVVDESNINLNTLIDGKFSFLMVGTLEPRKGHSQVLDAFEILWHSNEKINLVIVGKQGWMVDALVNRIRSHPELGKHLFWLENVSDTHLKKLYSTSTGLIAASHAEGFGLPLIEAAHHKLPIIARDIPVFREVAGGHAHYLDMSDPSNFAASITQWLALYREGLNPKSDAMPRLTWKESTKELISALKLIS